MRIAIRRWLGAWDLLTAFVIADGVTAFITLQLAGDVLLAVVVGVVALMLAFAGYRAAEAGPARVVIMAGLVFALLIAPQLTLLQEQGPNSPVHDGVLITDAAADRLIEGTDPYGHDYIDSPTRSFFLSDVPVNFGLRQYVYPPALILIDVPVRLLAPLAGGRPGLAWLFIPALLALAGAAWSLGTSQRSSQVAVIAVVLNPLTQLDFVHFLNDVFFLAPAIGAVALARRGRPLAAGVLFGLALATKQQAILFAPFLLIFAWLHWNARQTALASGSAVAVAAAVIAPFLVWNQEAFVGGVAAFFYGSGVDAYPIRGVGVAGLLLSAGLIPSRWAPFPAAVPLQIVAVGLVLVAAATRLRRSWSWPAFWGWMGAGALAVFLFGRVLAPNYLDIALALAILGGALWLIDEGPAASVARRVDGPAGESGVVRVAAPDDLGHLTAGDGAGDLPVSKVEPVGGAHQLTIDRPHRRGQPG